MIRFLNGAAPIPPETCFIGSPLKFPTQVATVQSVVKPTVQVSRSDEVPVFTAAGNGKLNTESTPKAKARA